MVTSINSEMVSGLQMTVPGIDPCFVWSQGAKFKPMCEFTTLNSAFMLGIEYDDERIPATVIEKLISSIPRGFATLCKTEAVS